MGFAKLCSMDKAVGKYTRKSSICYLHSNLASERFTDCDGEMVSCCGVVCDGVGIDGVGIDGVGYDWAQCDGGSYDGYDGAL